MTERKDAVGESLLPAFLDVRDRLARLIGRFVKSYEVDDILQETYIRTYVASQTTRIRDPRAFMVKTARNLALNVSTSAYNRRRDQTRDFEASIVSSLKTETMESQFESQELFLAFCRAVRSLPLQCRRVFVLKKVYGMSQQDIARYLQISERTVEKHVAKGLLMCAQWMEERGFDVGSQGGATAPGEKWRGTSGG